MRHSSFSRFLRIWYCVVIALALICVIAGVDALRVTADTAIVIASTLVVSVVVHKRILRPIRQVTATASAIAEGAVAERASLHPSADEDVQQLATAINVMADKAGTDIAELRRLERVRSEFVANVSHELRTPIFSVQGYLETLLDGALQDPTVSQQFVEKAYSNAMRLNALLSDLIDISRIESGELRLSFRYFNIASVLHDLVQTMEIRATQRMVQLTLDPSMRDDVNVYGDKERLTQVLTNLIDNAIKYNVPDGRVVVLAQRRGADVVVTIADTGLGIPKEQVHRIFERFYRVDKDRSRAVGGTGLGLAIVKHILEAHHSSVHVESDVGKGTTITFTLRAEEDGR